MSHRNGDRARADRKRKEKLQNRIRVRELEKARQPAKPVA
jgi:hypothetical protein